jgi:general secretion pathway protein H
MEMPVTSVTGNRGFTLLELLVVLAIMVLLAGAWPFAAPRLFPTQQLRNEAQRLIAALRSTRTTARISGVSQSVELLAAGEGYQTSSEPHQLPAGVIARMRNQEASRPSGVMFFPDGSSTGGVIDLKLPSRTVSVEVGKITGRAELVQ